MAEAESSLHFVTNLSVTSADDTHDQELENTTQSIKPRSESNFHLHGLAAPFNNLMHKLRKMRAAHADSARDEIDAAINSDDPVRLEAAIEEAKACGVVASVIAHGTMLLPAYPSHRFNVLTLVN